MIKKILYTAIAFSMVFLTSCADLLELSSFISAPYGYVYDSDGTTPIPGATVTIKKAGTAIETAQTTSSTGYFTFNNKVATKGGTYTVEVVKPDTGTFNDRTFVIPPVIVPSSEYLWRIGNILAEKPLTVATITTKVQDAKSTTGALISGVTVKLRTIATTPADVVTATEASGVWSLAKVPTGTYELVASKTGYAFISQIVNISNAVTELPPVLGLTSSNDVSVILVWNGASVVDLDAHLTVPNDGVTGTGTFNAYGIVGSSGFTPADTDVMTNRTKVSYLSKTFRGITLDVDANSTNTATVPRMETITLPSTGLTGTGGSTITAQGDGPGDLVLNSDKWLGVLQYYVDAFGTPTLSTQGSAFNSGATVYVLQSTNMLGRYEFPKYTALDKVSVLRIHAFNWGYIIYPDFKVSTGSNYRNLMSDSAVSPLVIRTKE